MIKKRSLSVIIPVYNEEKTIGKLLNSLLGFQCVDEIITVDDGSKDATYRQLQQFKDKIKLIHLPRNMGKGYALYRGLLAAKGEIIIFCDSDLVGLKETDIKKLVEPLLAGKAKMILGQPGGKRFLGVYFESLTGERAFFKTDLLPIAKNFKGAGLGVETYLNSVFKTWLSVPLSCRHLEKFEKVDSKTALTAYLKEGLEIVRQRAKIEGFWSNEIERELSSLRRVKTWTELAKKIKSLPRGKLKQLFKKYILAYTRKIKNFLTE
jgi:glycosyltransferase involved in cell wall biosynthesis